MLLSLSFPQTLFLSSPVFFGGKRKTNSVSSFLRITQSVFTPIAVNSELEILESGSLFSVAVNSFLVSLPRFRPGKQKSL